MTGGRKRKCRVDLRSEANMISEVGRRLLDKARQISDLQQDFMPFDSPASGSVVSEGDTVLHGSEDEAEAQRQPKKVKLMASHLEAVVERMLRKGKLSAEQTDEPGSNFSPPAPIPRPSSSPEPPSISRYPPRPKDGSVEDLLKWRVECTKLKRARAKVQPSSDYVAPTVRAVEDGIYNDAVQDWKSKRIVLAAARSVVNVTPISVGGGPTGIQCTGFILNRFEHSGTVCSVIVTSSVVVCDGGRLLIPTPKLSVRLPDRETVKNAQLVYFNDHYDIAFLLVSSELSLDIPHFGSCPEYNQTVFVLGRDKEASLAVTRGVISWTEEADFIGRDHYMFLDGKVPQGGTGGPVIDHDGVFRGMAYKLRPKPAVLSISTILSCWAMFIHHGCVARPMLGLNLRTVFSVDVDMLEVLSELNIERGYIVEVVHGNTPAQKNGICKGDVILSVNKLKMETLPELEDYLLSLGWKYLSTSVPTTDLEIQVIDPERQTKHITMSVGFSVYRAPELED